MTEETFFAFYSEFFSDFLEIDFIHRFIPMDTTYDFFKFIFFNNKETVETSTLTAKALILVLLFISVRAVAPRYKYIQLIELC
jgi:NADH:ubiquinone oxidoreductase subunit H